MDFVRLEKNGYKALICLQRPKKLNALNFQMITELDETLAAIRHDRDVRVVLVHGEGKAFCVGADLKERKTLTDDEVRRNVYRINRVCAALDSMPQPTMAVLHGYAFGGGFELALACDFRYAQEGTQMGLTEVSLGIIPGAGGTIRLPRLIGKAKAKELILMAKRFDAEEALRIGAVNRVSDDAWQTAINEADRIEEMAPLAVRQAKFAIDKGMETDHQTGLDIELKAYELLIPTADRMEGLRAFSEKRKPDFKGE
jgi:enoyl-CoA hydratase